MTTKKITLGELLEAAKRVCDEFANLPVDTNEQQVALVDLRMAVNNAEHDLKPKSQVN